MPDWIAPDWWSPFWFGVCVGILWTMLGDVVIYLYKRS